MIFVTLRVFGVPVILVTLIDFGNPFNDFGNPNPKLQTFSPKSKPRIPNP